MRVYFFLFHDERLAHNGCVVVKRTRSYYARAAGWFYRFGHPIGRCICIACGSEAINTKHTFTCIVRCTRTVSRGIRIEVFFEYFQCSGRSEKWIIGLLKRRFFFFVWALKIYTVDIGSPRLFEISTRSSNVGDFLSAPDDLEFSRVVRTSNRPIPDGFRAIYAALWNFAIRLISVQLLRFIKLLINSRHTI